MNLRSLLAAFLLVQGVSLFAQNDPVSANDPAEVRFIPRSETYHPDRQRDLRELPAWQEFIAENGTWYVHFDERSGMPHRAYGKPIPYAPAAPQDIAWQFIESVLPDFGVETEQLFPVPDMATGKYTWVNYRQHYNGLEVLGSRAAVKLFGNNVVLFSSDVYPDIELSTIPALNEGSAILAAYEGVGNEILSAEAESTLSVLPVHAGAGYTYHLVYTVMVRTQTSTGIPANYYTLVDAHDGTVLYRQNRVTHTGHPAGCMHPGHFALPLEVTANISGEYHPTNPWEATTTGGLPNIFVTVSGTDYQADQDGSVTMPVNPGSTAQIRLMGPWARVYSNNVTPQASFTLQAGSNDLSMNTAANLRERTAYVSVQRIHDHMKAWMPTFDGMDFQLETNVDVAGECNAFYDGSSINFYAFGGGCNATALIADVAFHEYGHGINDNYYQSLGGWFQNGAIGEGYADFWALSLTDSPILGSGFYTESQDGIRRYDEDPKIYPADLVGEVHADGEIIMGAWWDTHLLMGSDWNLTMPLFVEAYAGLQAEAFNGDEGEAFTDILIDVLQADDNDGDITNGTPNGNAIVTGFDMHGITLLGNGTLTHTAAEFAPAQQGMTINANFNLQFPFTQYLQEVECTYRINDGAWESVPMENVGGIQYQCVIPAQPASTVVSYYIGTRDVNNTLSNVLPKAAAQDPYPNIPFILLVGVEQIGIHDCDNNEDWGAWQTGLGADNASTGEWDLEIPIGSMTTDVSPGTIVQPFNQVTAGGEYCFITANAATTNSGIGEADVDGGHTTLQSTIIDMSDLQEPVVAYYRWYTNSPPGGANPGADWWQVRMSNNGGQSWVYIENNMTSDARWRRNAFRVSDYLEPTDEMRFQFIASDSIRPGQNLDGGSLVEAAVDDFILYDAISVSVEEDVAAQTQLVVYPNPVVHDLEVAFAMPNAGRVVMNLYNESGQLVWSQDLGRMGSGVVRRRLVLPDLAAGTYVLEARGTAVLTTRVIVGPQAR